MSLEIPSQLPLIDGVESVATRPLSARARGFARALWRNRWLYLLMTPSLLYFLIFKYIPLWNAQIAFKDFKPLLGVSGSPWVGLSSAPV